MPASAEVLRILTQHKKQHNVNNVIPHLMRDLHLVHRVVPDQRLEIPDQVRNDGFWLVMPPVSYFTS